VKGLLKYLYRRTYFLVNECHEASGVVPDVTVCPVIIYGHCSVSFAVHRAQKPQASADKIAASSWEWIHLSSRGLGFEMRFDNLRVTAYFSAPLPISESRFLRCLIPIFIQLVLAISHLPILYYMM